MEQTRGMQIAGFEVIIARLRLRQKRMRALLSSTLIAPEVQRGARLELETIMREIRETAEKLAKLEAGQ